MSYTMTFRVLKIWSVSCKTVKLKKAQKPLLKHARAVAKAGIKVGYIIIAIIVLISLFS